MKAPFGWPGVPRGLNSFPEKITLKRIISDGDKEAETNCRHCGYNTTDLERAYYGQIICDPETEEIIKQYHYCTFCAQEPWHKKNWWGGMDYKIHEAKVMLRITALKSSNHLYFKVLRQTLEETHYDEIHNAPYKEDDSGTRVYGESEAKFIDLTFKITECEAKPRHLYLEALEEFGGASDEPPCTRNLNKKQKKKLLRNLKEKLRECAST